MMVERISRSWKNAIAPLESPNSWTESKKQKIYNFYGVLESVAWIWRVIGIFPITIKGPVGIERYGINKFYAVYSFSIFAMCTAHLIYGMMVQFSHNYRPHVSMITITLLIRMIMSQLCMILTNVWRIVRVKELTETLNKMSEQELYLKKIGCRCNYVSNAKTIRRYVWTTFAIITVLLAYDYLAAYHTLENHGMLWTLHMFPLLAQIMEVTIFVSLVGWLGLKFRAINEKMRAVVTRANVSSPKIIVISDVCAENVRVLSKAHYNICAIGKRVNSIFDWNVILNVITAFIVLSTTLYYIFYEVQREGETDMTRIRSYIYCEFIHSAPIIVVVIICNWTSHQGIYTGKLIHEIRVKQMDSPLYEAVKSFSLQLHHQKLEFTAGGFFPLNSTLLQTMVGNITTNLVILIQFQPNFDDLFG